MPYLKRGNAHLYYEDTGSGEPIVTNHGVGENAGYWSESGVTPKLAERYRVISMDMRAHGETFVEGEPAGFDVETMADDIGALADHLGLERFHLLTHATGGMVGVRYAMTRSSRLISLMLTDTGSQTRLTFPGTTEEQSEQGLELWAAGFESATYDQIAAGAKVEPGVFLAGMAQNPDAERMYGVWERILRRGDLKTIAKFLRSFYTDPDPHVDLLRKIKCPTLVLLGELDSMFIESSDLMAKEIPDCRHIVMKGIGHMTAIEDTDGLLRELFDFLDCVRKTGRAVASRR
ncbi:MAG TPA: alpha/beta hydrolase [Dehalococcoidia bacterium]|nr:alpha/beta hydrolase [Dehalococcoidia bacterium]